MAEFMLAAAAEAAGLNVTVDSAGTSAGEVGSPVDPRARAVLARHGITGTAHTARKFKPSWFAERDLILALDTDHHDALRALAPTPAMAEKVRMLRSFDPAVAETGPEDQGIYDPWYGNAKDFEVTWDLIAGAIPAILAHVAAHGHARD